MPLLAFLVLIGMSWASASASSGQADAAAAARQKGSPVDESATVLRLAWSEDGARFRRADQLFLRGGSEPSLVRLPSGELLAVFRRREGGPGAEESPLWASRGGQDGKSWLPPRRMTLRGLPEHVRIGRPELVVMPSGLVRMYYWVPDEPRRSRSGPSGGFIGSAVTRDGLDWQVDRGVRVALPRLASARVRAFWADRRMVMFATPIEPGGEAASSTGPVQQFLSTDGRRFTPGERIRQAGGIGPVVQMNAHQLRMYCVTEDGIRARRSGDGLRWQDEPGVCLQDAFDPAVASLTNGKWLMLFCAAASPQDGSALQLVSAGDDPQPVKEPQATAGHPTKDDTAGTDSPASWDVFAAGADESELGADAMLPGGTGSDQALDDLGLAPLPDLCNHFDYVAWYEQNLIPPPDENAYFAYSAFWEDQRDDEFFTDMFNSGRALGLFAPWNPADRPDWEASYQGTQDLIDRIRLGTQDPRPFACPLSSAADAPEDRLPLPYQFPSLAKARMAVKLEMSQAWRTEAGLLPPERMRTALCSSLGTVEHLQEGPRLIERLVANANRDLVEENARWALQKKVFTSPAELEATLELLRERDLPDPDPGGWIRAEHAAGMDAIQYLFEPRTVGDPPALRPERIDRLLEEMVSPAEREQHRQELLQLTPADARSAVEDLDSYYRQVSDWYTHDLPRPDPLQFDRLASQMNDRNRLSGMLVPSVARVDLLMQRTEASRRATRLAYSVELFKGRYGRYPGSLDELPAEHIQDVRTDPFSGRDLAYRLTESGPIIYSVSQNAQDDGGSHSRNWSTKDHIFWPPQE